ncbi:MAG: zinc-ribbon domain-containing protein, partial [Anaerolineae bacterium]|nr:zinc-ribbon domain-containing protein [Anaerolineae bacterium]
MIQCTHCNHDNPEGLDFCLNCASPLSLVCPSCGEKLPKGYKFCGHCGHKIESEAKKPTFIEEDLDARRHKMLKNLQSKMPNQLTKKMAAVNLEMVGQRRDVTVLFA